jgi:multidrug resistance efflux pump
MILRVCVTTTSGLAAITSAAYFFWPAHDRQVAMGDPGAAVAADLERESVLVVAPGVTEPRSRTIHVTSELPGKLRAIHVRAGEPIREGQVIAELDHDQQKIAVQLAEAELDRARSNLDKLRNGERAEDRAIAQAMLDEAEAALQLAEFEAARVERLAQSNSVSDREVAEHKSALALAKARRDAARGRRQLTHAGPRSEDLAAARAVVREAEARLAAAQIALDKTFIRSPITGIVIYRFREPGEAVAADNATPIVSVGDCSRLHVRVDVDEADINKVWLGQRAYAEADAFGNRRLRGEVVHIEPTLGCKNFRTFQPTERVDMRIREVVVQLEDAGELPVELQMTVSFLDRPPGQAGVELSSAADSINKRGTPVGPAAQRRSAVPQ